MQKIINGNEISLGVCYYPEHWQESDWEPDLKRMKEHGIKTVRIAEFSWTLVEPQEGVYTFDLFDRFLDLAEKMGMQVIMGTPTATPPAWLTKKYPEVLNTDKNGVPFFHGGRRHYNYNSPKYQELSAKITEQYAKHYASHPAVIGWQLDNEFNCESSEFYSESDSVAFREFLKKKYHTLEALNEAWGTVFWSQTYTDWEEIFVPRNLNADATNPHLHLDYFRFISDSVCRYAKLQEEILRKYIKPDDFITTNGIFGNIDYKRLMKESLDFLTYDSYPNFGYCLDDYNPEDLMKDRKWSRNLMETRAVAGTFGIMEQQSGANGWNRRMEAPTPKPGQMTLWTMQSIGHGADFISYFRWRTAIFGTEMYWHGILDYSGRENRRLRELGSISKKIDKLQEVAGTKFYAKAALLKDYDNAWDAQVDKWHARVQSVSEKGIFEAAQLTHTPLDFVYLDEAVTVETLKQYEILFYPHASILTEERMRLLEEYVAQGGILVMGCRTGYKEIHGKCVRELLPGLASKLAGTDVPEYSFVSPEDKDVYVEWDGERVEASVFHDQLAKASETAQVLGTYRNCYYEDTPALICNAFGKGKAFYFGGAFTRQTVEIFLKKTGKAEPYRALFELPQCCELAIRRNETQTYYFILNYSAEATAIDLREEFAELLSGETVSGIKEIPPYGVLVLK